VKKKILFVDDDRLILASIGKGLESLGYDVTMVSNGKSAVELIEKERFDLALLDIRMPEIDGIELARMLIKQLNLPVVFLSAYSDENIIDAAISCGAISFLLKPCSLQQLKISIETALKDFETLKNAEETCQHLEKALSQSRSLSLAVGILMSQFQLNEQAAFKKLRQQARSERRKIIDVADEIIRQLETH